MKLTGKCKEDFEKWFFDTIQRNSEWKLCEFRDMTNSMQYGGYVDFFDSVGIKITVMPTQLKWFNIRVAKTWIDNQCETRPEARIKAIGKANELYNLDQGKSIIRS